MLQATQSTSTDKSDSKASGAIPRPEVYFFVSVFDVVSISLIARLSVA
jgi:hypothetical protein